MASEWWGGGGGGALRGGPAVGTRAPPDLGRGEVTALLLGLTVQHARHREGHGTPGRAPGSQKQREGTGSLQGRDSGRGSADDLQTRVGPGPRPLRPREL